MQNVSEGLSVASSIIGENTVAGKALAVASATISTYASIAGQLQAFSGVPIPGYAIAQAITTGLVGLKAVKDIISVKVPNKGKGSGSSSVGVGSVGAIPRPQFNVAGNAGVNQIASTLANQQPIKAYVVGKEVSTQQSLDRNIVKNATLG